MTALIAAVVSGFVGFLLAWFIRPEPSPSIDDIAEYMNAVVSVEEADARERRLRRQMFDADRKSLPNPESGSPARVTTMRLRR